MRSMKSGLFARARTHSAFGFSAAVAALIASSISAPSLSSGRASVRRATRSSTSSPVLPLMRARRHSSPVGASARTGSTRRTCSRSTSALFLSASVSLAAKKAMRTTSELLCGANISGSFKRTATVSLRPAAPPGIRRTRESTTEHADEARGLSEFLVPVSIAVSGAMVEPLSEATHAASTVSWLCRSAPKKSARVATLVTCVDPRCAAHAAMATFAKTAVSSWAWSSIATAPPRNTLQLYPERSSASYTAGSRRASTSVGNASRSALVTACLLSTNACDLTMV